MTPIVCYDTIQALFRQGNVFLLLCDIRFDTPMKQWLGSLTRPTVCFYLCDL